MLAKKPRPKRQDPWRIVAPTAAIGMVALTFLSLVILTWPMPKPEKILDLEIAHEEVIPELDAPAAATEEIDPIVTDNIQPVEVTIETPTIPSYEDLPALAQPACLPAPTPTLADSAAVALIKSPVTLKSLAGGAREKSGRAQSIRKFGGTGAAEQAVLRALRWLKCHQLPNGCWKAKGEGDATAFALLAFLAHGESITSPEFGETVKSALEWIIQHHQNNMAVYALAEAAAVIRTPVLAELAESAVRELCQRQRPIIKANAGGVIQRYSAAMAMMSARLAKLKVPELEKTTANFREGYLTMRDAKAPDFTQIKGLGTWHYMIAGVCLQYLGRGNDDSTRRMLKRLDEIWEPATLGTTAIACCPVRSNYFATMIFFNAGGPLWQKWNQGMLAAYVQQQQIEGETGYWQCQDQHIGDQPFWPTVYIVHQLMVYYRYLPTYTDAARVTEPESVRPRPAEKEPVLFEVDI